MAYVQDAMSDSEMDDAAPYSLWWWLDQLEDALVARSRDIDKCEAYYAGQHRLAFATSKFREAFGNLFREFSDNWCELVVDSSVERVSVQGFMFDKDDPSGDTDAWGMWQANNLDSESVIAHTTSVKVGMSYVMAGPGEDGMPEITVEHPGEVIVATAPGNRRKRMAALKRWCDDLGFLNATVYLPDVIYKFQSEQPVTRASGAPGRWLLYDQITNPLGVVPIIPLPNDPDGRGNGTSDIAQVIPTQDAVNKLIADMMVAAEFAAFPQRYATGIEIPEDDSGLKMVNDFMSGASRLWAIGDPDTKLGSFPESDLGNYVKGIELLVQHVAARTRTPPHYLLGQSGSFPSGDSLKATETGLVAKVRKKHIFFGEAWCEVMRLAFKVRGDDARALTMDAKTLWKDPESRSQGELVDSLVKMATIGVPEEALWQRYGASPQEIARWQQLAAEKAARVALLRPAAPTLGTPAELVTGLPASPTAPEAQIAP